MIWRPTQEAVQRLWGQRWVRRVSYGLVAGTLVYTSAPWILTRPLVWAWAARRMDALVREETGLGLRMGQVEYHPGLGALVLRDVRLGDDFLTVDRVEVQADLLSLVRPTHHIRSLRLEHPHLRVTEAHLRALRLKERPPREEPLPRLWVERLSLTDGEVDVPEPVRGMPALSYHFAAVGLGKGVNQAHLELTGPQLAVKGRQGWEKGRFDLTGEWSESTTSLQEAYLRLGETQVRLKGRLDTPRQGPAHIDAKLTGVVDLAQASAWAGQRRAAVHGRAELQGTLQGALAAPRWTFAAEAVGLRGMAPEFQGGALSLKANGDLENAKVETFTWSSLQGQLEASGTWTLKGGSQWALSGQNLDLEPLGRLLRVEVFHATRGHLSAHLEGPGGTQALNHPEAWQGSIQASFQQGGREAGNLNLSLHRGVWTADQVRLDLEAMALEGQATGYLDRKGLRQVEAQGHLRAQAEQVATSLAAWGVVDLDMAGRATGQTQMTWSRVEGLTLRGALQVNQARWHGATAEGLQGQVEIQNDQLWVRDIKVQKGAGFAAGNLWLTWAKTRPGQPQMDMRYTAQQLPLREGLRAADLKTESGEDLPILGSVSGWARLQGPFKAPILTGSAQVENGACYGLQIPAARADLWMDVAALRLKVTNAQVAETREALASKEPAPMGALALRGEADMDLDRWTWRVDLGGLVDTSALGLSGPRVQGRAEAHLRGPITAPYGGLDLPEGQVSITHGRLSVEDRSVDGLEGHVRLEKGDFSARLGFEGLARPLLEAQVKRQQGDLVGRLGLELSPQSAPTDRLARSLTDNVLEDLHLSATAEGRWAEGRRLSWSGALNQLTARFNAFELHQTRPSTLRGDARAAAVDLALEGGARASQDKGTPQAASLRLSGTVPFFRRLPMGIRAEGQADLAHLKSILDLVMEVDEYSLLSDLKVQGVSRFDLLAHGSYESPKLDGSLSLTGGNVHLRGYQGIEAFTADVLFKDRTLSIPESRPAKGTLAHGDLKGHGTMTWRPGGMEAYDFKATLSNFQLRDLPDGLDLQGSLQTSLVGDENGGVLKGRLRADRFNYRAEVKLSDLILRSALGDTGSVSGLDPEDPLSRIRLDLDLSLQQPWTFDTNLLKLEGRTEGPFQVVGTLAQPVPKGRLIFQPGGRITNFLPAGDLVVDRGSLEFSESRRLDPQIALQGSVSSIPGYTVNLDVRGTLSHLAIVPTSTPSLRQDEIVAILINPGNAANVGTASATSTATQGAITTGLASASFGLISTLAFAPLQEQLRRTLGLDRVNVAVRTTSLGTTETELTLGKSMNLLGQRSAFVVSHKKSGELTITSGQVEWRFGDFILQLGASKGGGGGLNPSGEIRHTWSPK